jgi:hypothetical protein
MATLRMIELFCIRPWDFAYKSGRKTRKFCLKYFWDYLCMLLKLMRLLYW